MRGLKINKASRKLDIVLVAARYNEQGMLEFAKGYERRGYVWTDVVLFDREALLQRVRSGAQIVTGDPVELPGNYDPIREVRIVEQAGSEFLVANGSAASQDDLGLPVL